jgi:NAD(P)-dependent dehydrogenase (short-subunit alcohol dehydrogenase family)
MQKVLITGAATGLGGFLRDSLASQGYFIYGTTRNLEAVKDSENIKFLHLDFTDKKSIDAIADYLIANDEVIDVFINNSGIAYLDPVEVLDEDEFRHIFDVNLFGPIYLTKKILPIMRKANKGNLIFISSIVSTDYWPYLGAYSASKAGIESIAFEWAALLQKWNIKVSVIQPNPLPTNMKILRSKNTESSPYPPLIQRNLDWENIEDVCDLISQIINDPSPSFLYQTGPHSTKAAHKFIKKQAYQKSLEKYQKALN